VLSEVLLLTVILGVSCLQFFVVLSSQDIECPVVKWHQERC
jgi:hypothetical protein